MTIDMELINKSFYQTIMDKNRKEHPIQILGEMYMDEKLKEIPDFSFIRYAQGEVYFLNQDYEAAIFKWENVLDEHLTPWARKNIADAHFQLDLLELAEEIYKAVESRSDVLQMEVFLQLFSLYTELGKLEKAVEAIKNAVDLNPDYTGVTELARTFFEEYKDWGNAVELAIHEGIRTKSLSWFAVLEEYIEYGLTVRLEPGYFREALLTLFQIEPLRFERLATALWNSYKQSEYYFQWLKEINQLLLNNQLEGSYTWKTFPTLFKETYDEWTSGKYLIKDFSEFIKIHFSNWIKISFVSESLVCSSAILAWHELFPSQIDASLVSKAKKLQESSSGYQNCLKDGIKLFESIINWADKEGLLDDLTIFIEPLMVEYNMEDGTNSKNLTLIQKAIEFLIDKKVEKENAIITKINWNEELVAKLNGIHHQLNDMEDEKARVIQDSFTYIKKQWRQEVMIKIPELLQNCSEMVKEDSDLGRLHVELNEEMNRRIANFMEDTALVNFKNAIQGWITDCEDEFKDCQAYLDEISESLNNLYSEEKIALDCDFKVLDDWQRDMDRMTRGIVPCEKANIMLRNTPSLLMWKSVGKLVDAITINKEKLYSKYKYFIESADYSQIAQSIISPFIQQIELFEKSIRREISMFFSNPFEELRKMNDEAQGNIEKHKEFLQYMRENPEIFRDPLTLFELKRRQYELMEGAGDSIPERV